MPRPGVSHWALCEERPWKSRRKGHPPRVVQTQPLTWFLEPGLLWLLTVMMPCWETNLSSHFELENELETEDVELHEQNLDSWQEQ